MRFTGDTDVFPAAPRALGVSGWRMPKRLPPPRPAPRA